MTLEEFGRRLRARRLELGLTLAQVAEAAGVSLPYVANLERARGNPTFDVLERLAGALGTTVGTLWDDPETSPPPAELPASLGRFVRSKEFAETVTDMAEMAGATPEEMRARVVASMVAAPRRASGEPTDRDWRRFLDTLRTNLLG